MSLRARLIAGTGVLGALTLGAILPVAFADRAAATYRVTLVNLTHGQPFSPPVAATHHKSIRMFRVGELATDQLAAIAQDGNEVPMAALFAGLRHVTDVVDPCSALNPGFPLAGDPNGNRDAEVATSPAEPIRIHPGIKGIGDLSVAKHGWRDPVARVTVERVG